MNNHKYWLLVVEDDADIRQLLVEDLERGFGDRAKIVQAKDGTEAKQKLVYQAFDCILTDLQMPNSGGGKAFIEATRANPINESTPIIVVSGFPDPKLERNFIGIRTVEKPYQPEQLVEVVEQQLKLGRVDQRVGAEVLNTLIDACAEFLRKVFKSEAELEKPYAKKPGDDLPGKVDCSLTIKTKSGKCILNIGFDQGVLDQLKQAAQAMNVDDETIVNKAMSLVFKYTSQIFDHNFGYSPALEQRTYFASKKGVAYLDIRNAMGVTIPIRTKFGCIYAQAINSQKTKVAATNIVSASGS